MYLKCILYEASKIRPKREDGRKDRRKDRRMVKEVTDNDFEQEVLKSALPAMVDMWAPWCGPCRMLGPVVEKLAEDFKDKVKVCKLNVDENPQTASAYGVRSIPLVLFFKNGQKVDESLGAVPENILRPKVEALL